MSPLLEVAARLAPLALESLNEFDEAGCSPACCKLLTISAVASEADFHKDAAVVEKEAQVLAHSSFVLLVRTFSDSLLLKLGEGFEGFDVSSISDVAV